VAWRSPSARGGLGYELADLSPDGRAIVYQGGRQLYLRRLDELDSAPLRGTEGGVAPFFSPDGEWVGFFTETKLQKVSIRTGAIAR
jgi:serine/threonine-protein kinase